jgi:predicted transcriptional regulator
MQLTINLPDPAFQRLSRLAELTNQPLSELVIQSIAGNLPPAIETAPVEIQAELLTLQSLSVEGLRQIAQSQIPSVQQECHIALLEQNQEGLLTGEEQRELQELSLAADRLMLKKAHACAILHWRGQPIRDLNQLSPN